MFLTDTQRSELDKWAEVAERTSREKRRAKLLLLLDEGLPAARVAKIVGIKPHLVKSWKNRWEGEGIDGLKDRPRPGRKTKLVDDQIRVLQEEAKRGTRPKVLKEKFGVSRMTIWRGLQRLVQLCEVTETTGPAGMGVPEDFGKMMSDACGLYHSDRNLAAAEEKFAEISDCARKDSDWHPVALRAELNMMYLPYAKGDLKEAERRASQIYEKTKQEEKRLMAVEAALFLARIWERQQFSFKVNFWLDAAQNELNYLYQPPSCLDNPPVEEQMPSSIADSGHSLVIPDTYQVPLAFFQAEIFHFRGKSQIQDGLFKRDWLINSNPWTKEVTNGIQNLQKAFEIDKEIKADSSVRWDLLWQIEGRAYIRGIDKKSATDCLTAFSGRTGAWGGYCRLFKVFLDDFVEDQMEVTDDFQECRYDGFKIFANLPLWSGLAAMYYNDSKLGSLSLTGRLEAAFAAASLEPYTYYLGSLAVLWEDWVKTCKPSKPKNFVQDLEARLRGHDGNFSHIQTLLERGGKSDILEQGIQQAVAEIVATIQMT